MEKEDYIASIFSLITLPSFDYFYSDKIVTKGFPSSTERIKALIKAGYKKSEEALVGTNDNIKYYDYWYIEK